MSIQYTYTSFVTPCSAALFESITSAISGVTILQMISNSDTGNSIIELSRALTNGEKSTLDGIISTWECPIEDDIEDVTFNTTTAVAGQVPVWNGSEFEQQELLQPIIQIPFCYDGKAKNKWLSQFSPDNEPSDAVPFVVPFDMVVKSITFVGSKEDVDTDIQIWRASVYDDLDDANNIHTVSIRGTRSKTLSGVNLEFTAGDKIGMYLSDKGTDAQNPVVVLWCQPHTITNSTITDNFDDEM